jgi:hypothetical protein
MHHANNRHATLSGSRGLTSTTDVDTRFDLGPILYLNDHMKGTVDEISALRPFWAGKARRD